MSVRWGVAWSAMVVALLAAPLADARPARPAPAGLFGSTEFRNHSPPQWLAVIQRLRTERAAFQACAADPASCPSRSMAAWLAELDRLRGRPPRAQLDALNRTVNRRAYKSDFDNFHEIDHWASPTEFMERSGDCEDYVIFKMFSLMLLGFPADRLRIVLVRDTRHKADHAVLAVYLEDGIYILDNNEPRVLPHRRIAHYVPVLSFGWRGAWEHLVPRPPKSAHRGGPSPTPASPAGG